MTPANVPTVHLDRSTLERGLCLELNGREVDLESAFSTGIYIGAEDMPAAATLLSNFVRARDEHAR